MTDIMSAILEADFFILFLHVSALAYLTKILLIDHAWPFKVSHPRDGMVLVNYDDGAVVYPVDIMHRIRRLFGVYSVDGDLWRLKNIDLWTCAFCLGFRINLLLLLVLKLIGTYTFLETALLLFAAPFLAGFMVNYIHVLMYGEA